MMSWLKAKLGRIRMSTVVLLAVFCLLLWVQQTFPSERATDEAPAPAVVPPGFVPDPDYTWVPRTNVRTDSPGPAPTSPTTWRNPVGSLPPGPQTGTQTPLMPPASATTSAGPTAPTTVPTG